MEQTNMCCLMIFIVLTQFLQLIKVHVKQVASNKIYKNKFSN